MLRIEHLLKKRPSALAGGDMQRVTIGRALVRRPSAMLMDEPIGALDAKLREQMRTELRRLHVDNDSTTVYVTHDQVEAMSMADKIGIMNDGVLQQYDSPTTVYDEPANLFVAQFVGSPIMNVVDCRCELTRRPTCVCACPASASPSCCGAGTAAAAPGAPAAAQDLALGIRPEAVGVQLQPTPGLVRADVQLVEPLGAYDIVDIAVGEQNLRARTREPAGPLAGPSGVAQPRRRAHALLRQAQRPLAARGGLTDMAAISLRRLGKRFGAVTAVHELTLDIRDREFFVLLGPTGAGKTTTLRCIAGLEQPDQGEIHIAGERVDDWSAAQRDVALVFQQYSLYPNYTVRENLAFPLKSKLRNFSAQQIDERVRLGQVEHPVRVLVEPLVEEG